MRLSENNASVRSTRKIGLRIAALTGAVLSAGAIAAAPAAVAVDNTDVVLDSIVTVNGGPGNGSTCCRPEN